VTAEPYRRDLATVVIFAGLLVFGLLNAVLGPVLPYLRASEGLSYLVAALHQVAFAIGGGVAGALAARTAGRGSRTPMISLGLAGAAVAGLGVGYGRQAIVTVGAAFLISLCGTSALIRMWAALADAHWARRAVALTEGEILVSLGGIAMPLLVAGLAASPLSWRFAFVAVALPAAGAVFAIRSVELPPVMPASRPRSGAAASSARSRVSATLVVVFAIVGLEFALSFWLASYLNDDVGLARSAAVLLVSGLYAANLAGRLVASRLARRLPAELLLASALSLALAGAPFLLAARGAGPAIAGIALTGAGIGAMFPLTSSLHVGASARTADAAMGQVLGIAAFGQLAGPLGVATIAQPAGLRAGLFVLPGLTLLAAAALWRHHLTEREMRGGR
jgi:fucose permease